MDQNGLFWPQEAKLDQNRKRSILASRGPFALKTLTSLNKESRPFFLDDNSIQSVPSVSSLGDKTAFGGPEGYFGGKLALRLPFGAFQFIVPKNECRLGRIDETSLDFLI